MSFVLPVPETVPDRPDATGPQWLAAVGGPTPSGGGAPTPLPELGHGGSVVMYRSGPGDVLVPRDEWLGVDLRNVPHDGVESGRSLFVGIPGPPPETHKGYDFPDQNLVIDRSRQNTALFWSDWYGSTAATAGGGGAFRGEHVVIPRVPPGSVQGYMPSDPGMVQANTDRAMPAPWDQNIVIGS